MTAPAPDSLPSKVAIPPLPQKKKRSWIWRLFKWSAIGLVLLLVIGRIVLWLALPSIVEKIGREYDLAIQYERLDLSILAGDIELWHLEVRDLKSDRPVAALEYLRADIAVRRLFLGEIAIRRVEVDGLDVWVDRGEDGTVSLAEISERFAGEPTAAAPEAEAPEADAPPTPLDLTPPIRLDAARLQHVHVHVDDRAANPPLKTTLDLGVRVSSIGHPTRPGRFEITAAAAGVLDHFRFEGTADARGKRVAIDAVCRMDGLHPHRLATYLEPMGFRPRAEAIDLSFAVDVKTHGAFAFHDAITGHVKLTDFNATADNDSFLGWREIVVPITAFGRYPRLGDEDRGGMFFGLETVGLVGYRARLARDNRGLLSVGGLKLIQAVEQRGVAAAHGDLGPAPVAAEEPAPEPVAKPSSPTRPGPIVTGYVRGVGLSEASLHYRDSTRGTPLDATVKIPALGLTDILFDEHAPDAVVRLVGRLESDGLFDTLTIDGKLVPFAPTQTASIDVALDHAGLRALRPWLDELGIEITDPSASFACHVDAKATPDERGVSAEARVRDVRWTAEGTTVGLRSVAVDGIRAEPGFLRVASVVVKGLSVDAEREADGALRIPGVRLRPPPAANAPAPAAPPRADPAAEPVARAGSKTRLEIGSLEISENRATFVDRAIVPAATIEVADIGVELRDIAVELGEDAQSTAPARFAVWAKLPRTIESMRIEGTVSGKPDGVAFDLKGTGQGVTLDAVRPYLTAAGVEPVLTDGALEFGVKGDVRSRGDRLDATVRVTDFAFRDGDTPFASVGAVSVTVAVKPGETHVREVRVDEPTIAVRREKLGAIVACGIRTLTAPPRPTAPETPDPKLVEAKPSAPVAPAGPPSALRVDRASVNGARITWSDAAARTPVALAVGASVEAYDVLLGAEGPATRVTVQLNIDDVIDAATVDISCADLDHPERHATVEFAFTGLHAGPLDAYLPPTVRPALTSATLRGKTEVRATKHPDGGQRLVAEVTDVSFVEPTIDVPLLAMKRAAVEIERLDPAGGVITVDRIVVDGLTTDVITEADGTTKALGLAIPPAGSPAPTAAANAEPTPTPPANATPKKGVGAALARRTGGVPTITLRSIDIGVERARYRDLRRPESRPLELLALKLTNDGPLRIDAEHAEDLPPWKLAVTGRISPIVDRLDLRVELSPFASAPEVKFAATIDGIHGRRIAEALPDLRDRLTADELEGGRFTMTGDAILKMRRRDPLDFPFDRAFGAQLELRDIAFRAKPDGEVVLGLDALRADVRKIDPSGAIHVKTLEIENPIARLRNTEKGLHALGLVILKQTKPEGAPEATPESPPAAKPTPPPVEVVAKPAPVDPGPEFRIDRLVVTDVDLVIRDETYTPVLLLPVNQMDVDVRGFSTHMFHEPKRMRFAISLGTGEVAMPQAGRSDLLANPAESAAGAATDTAKVVTGSDVKQDEKVEMRPLVQDLAIAGNLQFVPALLGRVKVGVSALELRGLKGVAAASGVTISNGLFDSKIKVDFTDDGNIVAATKFVFTDLSLSEPSDGPIFRYLRLPAPLDTVLFVLKDQSGAVTIPLDMTAAQGQIGTGQIAGKAVTLLGELIARAIAASPFRIVGGVTDLAGLTGGEEQGPPASTIPFEPGAAALTPDMRVEIDRITELMRDPKIVVRLEHVFGGDDLALADRRANPSVAECAAVVEKLRGRKRALLVQRSAKATRARAIRGAQITDRKRQAEAAVVAIDRELGQIERSLDGLAEFLRRGAERYATRRTRAAAIELATRRLEALRDALIGRGVTAAEERVRIARPRYPKAPPQGPKSVVNAVPKAAKV